MGGIDGRCDDRSEGALSQHEDLAGSDIPRLIQLGEHHGIKLEAFGLVDCHHADAIESRLFDSPLLDQPHEIAGR